MTVVSSEVASMCGDYFARWEAGLLTAGEAAQAMIGALPLNGTHHLWPQVSNLAIQARQIRDREIEEWWTDFDAGRTEYMPPYPRY